MKSIWSFHVAISCYLGFLDNSQIFFSDLWAPTLVPTLGSSYVHPTPSHRPRWVGSWRDGHAVSFFSCSLMGFRRSKPQPVTATGPVGRFVRSAIRDGRDKCECQEVKISGRDELKGPNRSMIYIHMPMS